MRNMGLIFVKFLFEFNVCFEIQQLLATYVSGVLTSKQDVKGIYYNDPSIKWRTASELGLIKKNKLQLKVAVQKLRSL